MFRFQPCEQQMCSVVNKLKMSGIMIQLTDVVML